MPIQAPASRANPTGGEFRETTAPFRKTGPVEKLSPVSDQIKKRVVDVIAPVATRVEEMANEGKLVTATTLRAAEIATKIYKGENPNASDMAIILIAVREAEEAGLDDPKSPFYQSDTDINLRKKYELTDLDLEINGYLTQETRQPYEETYRRWRLPFRRSFPPLRSLRYEDTITITPKEDRELSFEEKVRSLHESRIDEDWTNVRDRITADHYRGKDFLHLTPSERRIVAYSTSEELSKKYGDGEVKKILALAEKPVSSETLDELKESEVKEEKQFAKRAEKVQEERENLLKKSSELNKAKTMGDFQRFMGFDEKTFSQNELTEAIIKKLGIFDEKTIKKFMSSPDKAFKRFYEEMGAVGSVTFLGELINYKLDKFEAGEEKEGKEKAPGEIGRLTKEGLTGLRPEALAIELADNKLGDNPIKFLKEAGFEEEEAKRMIDEIVNEKKFATKDASGAYYLNNQGSWDEEGLAILAAKGNINPNDNGQVAELRNQMTEALQNKPEFSDEGRRNQELDRRLNEIKKLAKITDNTLSEKDIRETVKKWKPKNLAVLVLLMGSPSFKNKVEGGMEEFQRRDFESLIS